MVRNNYIYAWESECSYVETLCIHRKTELTWTGQCNWSVTYHFNTMQLSLWWQMYLVAKFANLPHKSKKCSMHISEYVQTIFFYLERILKKLAHNTTFFLIMGMDWPEIGRLMEVYVWYLLILCFYFVLQIVKPLLFNTIHLFITVFDKFSLFSPFCKL